MTNILCRLKFVEAYAPGLELCHFAYHTREDHVTDITDDIRTVAAHESGLELWPTLEELS